MTCPACPRAQALRLVIASLCAPSGGEGKKLNFFD